MTNQLVSAYERIYTALKHRVADKVYAAGMCFPSPKDLKVEFRTNSSTIKKATEALVQEGYLRKNARGEYVVMDIAATQKLNTITSMTETLTAKGYTVTTHGMAIKREVAPDNVALALHLTGGSMVYKVQRLQCADGQPVAIATNYLLPSQVPGLEEYVDAFVSLYAFLEAHYHICFEQADEYLTAVGAGLEESLVLKVPVGAPLLRSRRITYAAGAPFGYDVIKLVPDKYEYYIHLQGRSR